MLYDLHRHTYNAETIVLGDSVGRQIAQHLAKVHRKNFISLATNGSLEMTGQYYIFLRYLERNKGLKSVILLMHRPLHGNLSLPETENYLQRCFTRWYEIAGMTLQTGKPGFGLRMLTYWLASAKYRLHLQKLVPGLQDPEEISTPQRNEARLTKLSKKGPLLAMVRLFMPHKTGTVSEHYLLKFLDECQRRNIRVCYLPCPLTERQWTRYEHGPAQTQLVSRMKELSRHYSNLVYSTDVKVYPGPWFADGLHIEKSHLPQVAGDYALMMDELMPP